MKPFGSGVWIKDKPNFDRPVPMTIITEDRTYEDFKAICAELHVKHNEVLTSLMRMFIDHMEDEGF